MSAFGVVCIALGVLMMWAGLKGQKVNEVLQGFVGKPQAHTASTGPVTPTVQVS